MQKSLKKKSLKRRNKMAKSTLVREKIAVPSFDSDIRKLARKAHENLGYGVLVKVVKQPNTLAKALRKLDIHPYSAKSVAAYKEEMQKKIQEKAGRNYRVQWHTIDISRYQKPIPEFALNKALQ